MTVQSTVPAAMRTAVDTAKETVARLHADS